uniref:Uncharacterized protein n=1 Tax=Peronospora matthiolae TaxID=2874970 RepID=A0AAV1TKA6_9STRA
MQSLHRIVVVGSRILRNTFTNEAVQLPAVLPRRKLNDFIDNRDDERGDDDCILAVDMLSREALFTQRLYMHVSWSTRIPHWRYSAFVAASRNWFSFATRS